MTRLARYRLGRVALDQREFLATELAALAHVPLNTVYGFLADMGARVTSESLGTTSAGRPRKLYALTEEGVDYLLDQNLEIARILKASGTEAENRSFAATHAGSADKGTLHDAFIVELQGMYGAERQCAVAMPQLARLAIASELRATFEDRLHETKAHVNRLTQLFGHLNEEVRTRHSPAVGAILEQGTSVGGAFDQTAQDACLIAAARRMTHYAIATYETLVGWATRMDFRQAAELLQASLDEERAADAAFAALGTIGGLQVATTEAAGTSPARAAEAAKSQSLRRVAEAQCER